MSVLVFYNETTVSQGRVNVMTELDLPAGTYSIKTTVEPRGIHTHKMEVYKNLHHYLATPEQIKKLKDQGYSVVRTSFV